MEIDVMFGPSEFEGWGGRPRPGVACVVFDVLRATSTVVTALENGAEGVLPVATVEAALEAQRREGALLLAGERGGVRIGREITGGREFDLGNSPREFTRERVEGRRIAMTTTNGTRALRACAGAERVYAGSFLNLTAVAQAAMRAGVAKIVMVCSGTGEETALEDALAAGAGCALMEGSGEFSDAAWVVYAAWEAARSDVAGALGRARNAQRLRAMPALSEDVDLCLRRDVYHGVPRLMDDGWLRLER